MMHEGLIAVDANVCHGKPCIKGTRILVSSILSQLAAGYDFDKIKAGYLELTDQHILAALEYARAVGDSIANRAPNPRGCSPGAGGVV